MAISKGANTYNRMNWETSEFPILCETCLGDNPYVRMMRENHGKECKICTRPFTVFRWSPGKRARYKKTEICQTCAKLKNVCQTCILDLEYGLPVEVRDKALKLEANLPKSEVNREYFQQQVEREMEDSGQVALPHGELGKARAPSDMLLKLARTTPYYKRNRPHICSFWVKGECRRGDECPYRHEKPTDPDDPLADQNIRDRFYGTSDPVAEKLMRKYDQMPKLTPPEDRTITTLYVGGLTEGMTEQDLRDHFYQFGELRSVSVHAKQSCAFVQFTSREAAERAAEKSYDKLIVRGRRLNLRWGKSQAASGEEMHGEGGGTGLEPVPGLPGALPMPPPDLATFLPPPMPGLPPPMPPSGFRPPMPPPLPPPMHHPHHPMPPPPQAAKSLEPPPPGTVPLRLPEPSAVAPWPGVQPVGIHYPSQDPNRIGSFTAGPSRPQ